MISKKNRVSKSFFKNNKGSRTLSLPSFTLRIITTDGATRAAFVVSKQIEKTAVKRNKLRRKGYASLEKIISKINKGLVLIFYMKTESVSLSVQSLSKEIEKTLIQGGFLKN